MSEDNLIEFLLIPGIGRAKARALYEAGYTDLADLLAAPVDNLEKVRGIGPDLARNIHDFVNNFYEEMGGLEDDGTGLTVCKRCGSLVSASDEECKICGA